MTLETTLDGILDRRVMLEQPKSGYRIAVDTVLLAAAVPAVAGDHILDLGCGVGGAAMALACRVAGTTGVGIDIQGALVMLFGHNIARNPCAVGWTAQRGDVTALPQDLHGVFDHVIANPPYHDQTRHDVSANAIKQTANNLPDAALGLWIDATAQALKPDGTLTLIHRADYQDLILGHLRGAFGAAEILPICPKPGAEPKRIIIRARRGAECSIRMGASFILHKPHGGYTDAAEAVLRERQALFI